MITKFGARMPHGMKQWVRTQFSDLVGLADKRAFVRELYELWEGRSSPQRPGYALSRAFAKSEVVPGLPPIPPKPLWVGYCDTPEHYLSTGHESAEQIRKVWKDHGVRTDGMRLLDWGCAAGRVLRNFEPEAVKGEFWGADISERAIFWNGANLSPPFHFVTCTQYPHLPFEDNYFDFVYAISVFTHMEYLVDTWLMELRRIMKPGGMALFTINDHASIRCFKETFYPYFLDDAKGDEILKHDAYVIRSKGWEGTLPFYSTDFISKWWSRYFEVVEVRELYIDRFQAAVILRKRA